MKNTIKLIGIIAIILFGFAVIACDYNSSEWDGYEPGVTATTNSGLPGNPLSLTVEDVTTTAVTLSWAAPAHLGTSTITGYQVSINGGAWTAASTDTGHTFTGLPNNTDHNFRVRPLTADGPGRYSSTSARTLAP
ncbi:MAG: fibronectin type III domain-containing protein [Spirochaetaceae bacterium]|nr:fibronectin type III domain-containing protein [Spirochaetaceae bacterium]